MAAGATAAETAKGMANQSCALMADDHGKRKTMKHCWRVARY